MLHTWRNVPIVSLELSALEYHCSFSSPNNFANFRLAGFQEAHW